MFAAFALYYNLQLKNIVRSELSIIDLHKKIPRRGHRVGAKCGPKSAALTQALEAIRCLFGTSGVLVHWGWASPPAIQAPQRCRAADLWTICYPGFGDEGLISLFFSSGLKKSSCSRPVKSFPVINVYHAAPRLWCSWFQESSSRLSQADPSAHVIVPVGSYCSALTCFPLLLPNSLLLFTQSKTSFGLRLKAKEKAFKWEFWYTNTQIQLCPNHLYYCFSVIYRPKKFILVVLTER